MHCDVVRGVGGVVLCGLVLGCGVQCSVMFCFLVWCGVVRGHGLQWYVAFRAVVFC